MPNYSTSLQTWGDTGTAPPTGYSYEDGEIPVDGWDNWFNYTVIDEIETLVGFINDDLLAADGSVTLKADLDDDQGNTIWDYSEGEVPAASIGSHASRHHSGGADELDAGNLSGDLGTAGEFLKSDGTQASWGEVDSYKGNDIDTDGDGVVNQADDADQYSGTAPGDGTAGRVLTTTGSDTQWSSVSGAMFGDGTNDVTVSSNQNMSGVQVVDTFTVQSGVTVTVPKNEILAVFASGSITVDGTIDGSGIDGNGASGGSSGGSYSGNGGSGGGGGRSVILASPSVTVNGTVTVAGGDGANGQSGSDTSDSSTANGGGDGATGSGMFFGGGTGETAPFSGGSGFGWGGAGGSQQVGSGDGGGTNVTDALSSIEESLLHTTHTARIYETVYLASDVLGADGGGGGGGSQGDNGSGGGGGGGGGGSGGLLAIFTAELIENGTLDASGGSGGSGGGGISSGGNGGGGEAGLIVKVT